MILCAQNAGSIQGGTASGLNDTEKAELKQLVAGQIEIRNAMTLLTFETLKDLDSSDQTIALVSRVREIKAIVETQVTDLGGFSAVLGQANTTVNALVDLLETIESLDSEDS